MHSRLKQYGNEISILFLGYLNTQISSNCTDAEEWSVM